MIIHLGVYGARKFPGHITAHRGCLNETGNET